MASDHRSLYRAYRPQTFADVVGQRHITDTLGRAVIADRVHHAYLFTGPRGTGKTSTARILAKALNCAEGPTATPCGQCQPCVDIADGSHVDVVEIDAASHGGVDDVRDLRDRVAFAPAQARTKVYIVDECHMLSTAGWNAFLRTVEEPPDHVLFVFATTEPHKVLDTITSRTQRFDFRRVGAAALAAHVDEVAAAEGVTLDPVARDLVVRAGDGSVRDTLSVLDQVRAFVGDDIGGEAVAEVLGTVGTSELAELADGIAAGDVAGLCALVGRLADAGVDLRQLARDAVEHLRRLLLLRAAPETDLLDLGADVTAELSAQAARMGTTELLRAVELLAEAQAAMRRGNIRLPLEIALIKAALPESAGDAAGLAARVERLERGAGDGTGTVVADSGTGEHNPPAGTAVRAGAPAPEGQQRAAAAAGAGASAADQPAAAADDPPPDPALAGPAASPGPATELTLEQVRARWDEVLQRLKSRKPTVHPWFATGSLTNLHGKVLTLSFGRQHALNAERLTDERVHEPISEVVEEVVGVRLLVQARVLDHETDEPTVLVADDEEEGEAGHGPPAGDTPSGAAAISPPRAPGAPAVGEGSEAAGGSTAEAGQAPPWAGQAPAEAGQPSAGVPGASGADEPADEQQAHQQAVELLQRELGARPMGDADTTGR